MVEAARSRSSITAHGITDLPTPIADASRKGYRCKRAMPSGGNLSLELFPAERALDVKHGTTLLRSLTLTGDMRSP